MALEASETRSPQAFARRRAAMFRDTRAAYALDVRTALEESGYWHHPTLDNFRNAVGSQRANDIIANLGTAAMRAAPNGLSVSLGTVVSTALGRLTQADIASLVRGDTGVLNRVQSEVEQQVKAQAQVQTQRMAQAPESGVNDGVGALGLPGLMSYALSRGQQRRIEESGERPTTGAGVRADAEFLRAVGISNELASGLAALGFRSREQVQQVVNDTRRLNLPTSEAAIPVARLRRAEGQRTDEHIDTLARYGRDRERLMRERQEAEREADARRRAERLREIDQRMRQLEQQVEQHRNNRVQTPEGRREFDTIRRLEEMHAERRARTGLQADNQTTAEQRATIRTETNQQQRFQRQGAAIFAADNGRTQAQAIAATDDVFGPTPATPAQPAPAAQQQPQQPQQAAAPQPPQQPQQAAPPQQPQQPAAQRPVQTAAAPNRPATAPKPS